MRTTKKGYVYTIGILLFLGVLLTLHATQTMTQQPIHNNQLRTQIMSDLLFDIEQDLERALFIAGFRALLAIEEHVTDTASYIDSTKDAFLEGINNATINDQPYEILNNSTLQQYLERVAHDAQTRGLTLNVTIEELTLSQRNPWRITVEMKPTIILEDKRTHIRWEYTTTTTTNIPITNLQDPFYIVETNNRAPNEIRTTDYEQFVNTATNDTTILQEFLINSYYVPNTQAPSFLQRYEGNTTAHEQGIQSLVNIELLSAQGITIYEDRSLVDYQYFFMAESANWCDLQEMPEYFKIDNDNRMFYQLDTLEATSC